MIHTRIYTAEVIDTPDVQDDIRQTLLSGKHVVFPTETVYGIGADAFSEQGIQNIYHVKGRPSDNPLIMHVSANQSIDPYVWIDHAYVQRLMATFWPGPLTLVFRKKATVPPWITGGLDTVGVRIPRHILAQKVLEIAKGPICAPSANLSGTPSATLFEHVLEDFNHRVDIMIDGGQSEVGLESTVLDVTQQTPVILRPGVITKAMLETVIAPIAVHNDVRADEVPKSPGMKYKHYAPKGILTIVEGAQDAVIAYINAQIHQHQKAGLNVGVMATDELIERFDTAHVFTLGAAHQEADIAANLYIALRRMDQLKMDLIYSVSFMQSDYQEVIMNRLYKAANRRIINV